MIETNFPLVGITERINETILLMEAVFPQFYTGLSTFEASLKLGGKYCTMYYCRYVPVQAQTTALSIEVKFHLWKDCI